MKVREKKWIRLRIYLIASFFVLGLGTLLFRAFQLQVLKQDRLEAIARSGYKGTIKLPPKRGTIRDREGNELAVSVEVGSVYAHPRRIKAKKKTAVKLAQALEIREDKILNLLKTKRSFVWIERRIDPKRTRKVEDLGLDGVGVASETRRFLPGREIGAHLIGFVGTDNQGLEGLEKRYDKDLRGPHNSLIQMRDALGRPFAVSRPVPSEHGMRDLVLTIDKDIQYKAQAALKRAVDKTKAKGGHCLVVDPKTGEILAMAVVPEFNPNIFSKYEAECWRNRSITDCFEPGSTIKAFLLAAALEESSVTPTTTFDCENGKFPIGGHVIHDTHEHGVISVHDIVVKSSNIGAIKIGQRLGYEKFTGYLKEFGFGVRSGIGLIGERSGFIRSPGKARPVDRANLFFGQGMTVTSLQLAMAMAAIANEGRLMKPFVVKRIVSESGKVIKETYPEMVRRVLSAETARKVAAILEDVTADGGTAPKAAIEGYRVAGKTGTSQKVDPKTRRYSRSKYVATFVGLVPVDRPRLVILVAVDEPKGNAYGGIVSAPVFREVGKWALNHLRINPQVRLVQEKGEVEKAPPRPELSEDVKRIALEVRSGIVPDFSGLGMRAVLKKAGSLGLEIVAEGSGLAVEQVPEPGTPLEGVKRVEVTFRSPV